MAGQFQICKNFGLMDWQKRIESLELNHNTVSDYHIQPKKS